MGHDESVTGRWVDGGKRTCTKARMKKARVTGGVAYLLMLLLNYFET